MIYRILVTGSRQWTDYTTISDALHHALSTIADGSAALIVHGAAPGADQLAHQAARFWGATTEPHPADWTGPCTPTCPPDHRRPLGDGGTYCPTAGIRRNQHMVDLGAHLCLAFRHGSSRGTADCITRAHRAGIPTRIHTQGHR